MPDDYNMILIIVPNLTWFAQVYVGVTSTEQCIDKNVDS